MLERVAKAIPGLHKAYRELKDFSKRDELARAFYQKLFERGRLFLPEIPPEKLGQQVDSIRLPAFFPIFAGEDTPLADLLVLLAAARGRAVRRVLEVGTYRARTSFALFQNCPTARIVSYDVQVLPSRYRTALEQVSQVELRHGSFSAAREILRNEQPFDFIFVDGDHRLQAVIEDSRLAFEILAPDGIILWHDYRLNGYQTPELRVPEALRLVRGDRNLFHVRDTTLAVYSSSWDQR